MAFSSHIIELHAFFYKNNFYKNNEAQISQKVRTSTAWIRLKKVKVFLVETLLSLVTYIWIVHNKNTVALHPIYY